jgi:serine protease Do
MQGNQNYNSNNLYPQNSGVNPASDPFAQTTFYGGASSNTGYNQTPQTNQTPKPKKEKKSNPILALARFVAVLIVLGLIAISGVFVYVIANPQDPRSQWLAQNTYLNRVVDLPNGDSEQDSSQSSSDPKIVNGLIEGQNNSSQSGSFAFVEPQTSKEVTQVVEEVLPSVLSLSLRTRGDNVNISQDLTAGTGYIVSEDGLVLTNKHVISVLCKNDPNKIQINALTYDQKAYELTLASIDPVEDIAILKIQNTDNQKFTPVKFSDSDNLLLGQDVIAVGNVLGELQNTITKGIVSGLNRSFETELKDECTQNTFQADNLIQTDAAINRGNSGGPLFNASGQLIGMNTLGTVDAQNIGLAIPTRILQNVLQGYQANNQIVRARLGVTSLQINALRRAQNNWIPTEYGELVFAQEGNPVSAGSSAANAGIKEGDIILEIGGERMVSNNQNPSPLRRKILSEQAGSRVIMKILKAINKSESGFTYSQEPVEIEVLLGSVSFDINTKEVSVQ